MLPAKNDEDISEFKLILKNDQRSSDLHQFLQNIFPLYPDDTFHTLIQEVSAEISDDEGIYRGLLTRLKSFTPILRGIRYALPELLRQKEEITRQTIELLNDQISINGYVEIGTTGRYISRLKSSILLSGKIVLVNDLPPSNSLRDIFERGGLRKIGRYVALNNFSPIPEANLPSSSVDLVTCFIGLHHAPPENLRGFVRSIHRALRRGGRFILRDHNAQTSEMAMFASVIHTVFNLGLGISWEDNCKEIRNFQGLTYWIELLTLEGFIDHGQRLLQHKDPSENALMIFSKQT
jgi:SAM-dependent methyltransferase